MKKTSVFVLLTIVLSMLVGWHLGSTYTCRIQESVVTEYDTIIDSVPVVDTCYLTGEKVKIPIILHDTIHEGTDSVFILVDREQKFYKDSTYAAWVSGIDAELDSIHVFRKTTTRTITKEKLVSYTPKEKIRLQGFVGGYKSFTTKDMGVNAGIQLTTPLHINVRAGYELNKVNNFPYIGFEYIIK